MHSENRCNNENMEHHLGLKKTLLTQNVDRHGLAKNECQEKNNIANTVAKHAGLTQKTIDGKRATCVAPDNPVN